MGLRRRATAGDEVDHPAPVGVAAILRLQRIRGAHLGKQRLLVETAAHDQRHAVLHQRRAARQRQPRLEPALCARRTAGDLSSTPRRGRHAAGMRRWSRGAVTAAAGTLHQSPRCPRGCRPGSPNDRREVDAGSNDDGESPRAALASRLDFLGARSIEPWCSRVRSASRAVRGNSWYQVSACERAVLVNSWRGARRGDRAHHVGQQLPQAEGARQGKRCSVSGITDSISSVRTCARAQDATTGSGSARDHRGPAASLRDAPGAQRWIQRAAAPTRVRSTPRLLPSGSSCRSSTTTPSRAGERRLPVGEAQHHRQALGRGHQRLGWPPRVAACARWKQLSPVRASTRQSLPSARSARARFRDQVVGERAMA